MFFDAVVSQHTALLNTLFAFVGPPLAEYPAPLSGCFRRVLQFRLGRLDVFPPIIQRFEHFLLRILRRKTRNTPDKFLNFR